ncbi:OmpW/AlkL family protein [Thalassotalea profundi]|uniref:Outer membrane protein OmpW n=1 Tax=Thalassotalea profundi TaxID=2036687 RepID=A0ABQ3J0C2_9GAMM|nr:OmpW family outer membrane protein [Thalassotalea profundi]GHE96481.1 outer membrane protein OmpW [Thalassotalea profundi]
MKKSLLALALLSVISISNAADYKAGDIVVRGGITNVNPDSSKSEIMLGGTDSTMSLSVDDNSQLGLNFVYFYDQNWAIEVLAASPFTHDVTIHDPNAVLNVDGAKLAEVTHLPPTVSAIYYFQTSTSFKPYVGLGLNYTVFFDEGFEQAPKSLGLSNLELDSSLGLAAQIGADFQLNDQWHINASVRYIDIDSEATFDVGGSSIGKADINVDPTVVSILIGYKF